MEIMSVGNCIWTTIDNKSILLLNFSGIEKKNEINKILNKSEIKKIALSGGNKELCYQYQNEQSIFIQVIGCHFNLEGKQHSLLLLADNTIEKEFDMIIRKKDEEIQKLKQQKDDFMVQIGHDLRTPLTPILNLLPLIKKNISTPRNTELIDAVLINAEQLNKHVNKILKFGKIKAFGTDLTIENLQLNSIVNKVISSFDSKISNKFIQIHNEIDDDIIVRADKNQLIELFSQFISNSIKYTNNEGIISIFAETTCEVITVSFQDNGCGLSSTQANHIFDEFYESDDSRHDLSSSGLGLSLCKTIVSKHGGKIWAFSLGDGEGVTFYFTLPKGNYNLKQ
jgi:signal transduction histidine kinase